jgi:AraC-like DNA-binding protein
LRLRYIVPEGNVNKQGLEIKAYTEAAGIIVIRVAGDFRGEGAGKVTRTLAGELAGAPKILLLDLTEVAGIDAEGIDTLHLAAELTADEDIGLGLVVPEDGAVMAGLDAVEATDTFQIFGSITEACLHHAHQDLLAGARPRDTVTEIAARWGFIHAGAFAAVYRQTYGQSPHTTLRGADGFAPWLQTRAE